MKDFERPAIALIVAVLTKRIKIGTEYRIGGNAYVKDWTKNKRTELQVRYISGKEVEIYHSESQLLINNYVDFTKNHIWLRVYKQQYSSEIIINRISYGEDRVEGEVKRNGGKEIYKFRFEVNEYSDLRIYDDESFGDEYRGYRQYQIDF